MNNKYIYSAKAEKYARYRWDYAPEAIEAIFAVLRFRADPWIADIGAGTGILTRHLAVRAGQVFAIEPNEEMRAIAARDLSNHTNVQVLDAFAEQLPLPSRSLDLITVAQAIHWFDPEPTRREFLRVLKPGGWLAILRNVGEEDELSKALSAIYTPEYGVDFSVHAAPSHRTPVEFYFGERPFHRMRFPFAFRQDWTSFFGAFCSASYAPDEDHPRFADFERAAHDIFNQYCPQGWNTVRGETELITGQPAESDRP